MKAIDEKYTEQNSDLNFRLDITEDKINMIGDTEGRQPSEDGGRTHEATSSPGCQSHCKREGQGFAQPHLWASGLQAVRW